MSLRTKKEIVSTADAAPSPLGERLWRPTSMVRLKAPLSEARGALKPGGRSAATGVIHFMRGDTCVTRPYVRPADPKTDRQLRRRAMLAAASSAWSSLTSADRAAWQIYAESFLSHGHPVTKLGNLGQNAFVSAQFYRLGMGLPIPGEVPAAPPPAAQITAIDPAAAPSGTPGALAFRITHDTAYPAALFLLLELTRPLPGPNRHAKPNEFLWAAAQDAESFLPLASSGTVYEISEPSVDLPSGARYAVRARLITPNGLPGPALIAYAED